MNKLAYTTAVFDYGVCHFCGQPIDRERPTFIRKKDGYETFVVHRECFIKRIEEQSTEE